MTRSGSDRELAHLRDRRHTYTRSFTHARVYIHWKRARRDDVGTLETRGALVYVMRVCVCVSHVGITRVGVSTYPTLGIAQVGVTWGGAR